MYTAIHKKKWLEILGNTKLVCRLGMTIPRCLENIDHQYLLIDEKIPIYVTSSYGGRSSMVLVPEGLENLPNSQVNFDNWNIALIEETRPYIRNKYKKNYLCSSNKLFKTGHYEFKEKLSGDQFEVYIWSDLDNWFRASYVIEETNSLSINLIKDILNDRGSIYKESNS